MTEILCVSLNCFLYNFPSTDTFAIFEYNLGLEGNGAMETSGPLLLRSEKIEIEPLASFGRFRSVEEGGVFAAVILLSRPG